MNIDYLVSGIICAIEQIHQFRDDCAIRAMGSLLDTGDVFASEAFVETTAKKAYQYADQMLKAKFN